jgi:hypothetical protein
LEGSLGAGIFGGGRESCRGGLSQGSGCWKGEEAEDCGDFYFLETGWAMARSTADDGRWA